MPIMYELRFDIKIPVSIDLQRGFSEAGPRNIAQRFERGCDDRLEGRGRKLQKIKVMSIYLFLIKWRGVFRVVPPHVTMGE